MNTVRAIQTRRSIRKYKAKNIDDKTIEKLLKAGMYAPSAMNLQPWHYIVVKGRKKLETITEAIPHAELMQKATLGILVCGDKKLEKNKDFIVQDCSAAVQNILLAAHDLGLGAVWIGIYPFKDIIESTREYFNLPKHILPVAMVSAGYPAEIVETENRFITERIHTDKW